MNPSSPTQRGTFLVIKNANEPSYIHCNSSEDYNYQSDHHSSNENEEAVCDDPRLSNNIFEANQIAVTSSPQKAILSPVEINNRLNLHLGLPFNPRNVRILKLVCQLLSKLLSLVENYLFQGWASLPLSLRQKITMMAWYIYFPLHKLVFANTTAIHKHASYEYHALTTILYWGRLFPVSIRQMRFSLSQLNVWHPTYAYPEAKPFVYNNDLKGDTSNKSTIHTKTNHIVNVKNNGLISKSKYGTYAYVFDIYHDMIGKSQLLNDGTERIKKDFKEEVVSGYYVQHKDLPSQKVIMWLYGGAFLSGDAVGNINLAEKIGQRCGYKDIFLPNYRLLPEFHFFDALHDTVQAYEYLVTVRNIDPKNIMLLGVSSGGGLVMRLLQTIAEKNKRLKELQNANGLQTEIDSRLLTMPSGAVLMSPFVDFTEPSGSFVEYTKHDLIVNESVFEVGTPYFETLGNDTIRRSESPVYRSFEGLPPLCILVSEHECCYDQDIKLCNEARKAGVQVDLGVWKYMCHVWPVLSAFLPEARQSVDFICDWINRQN